MYTRNHVCTLADMDVERFKSLARRNQLPTIYVPIGRRDDQTQDEIRVSGWNRFSTFDAICIAVTDALVRQMGFAEGLSYATAASIVSSNRPGLTDAFERWHTAPSGADIWIGYVAYGGGGGANRSGDLASITLKMLSELADGTPVAGVFAVNVSEVIREMARRAEVAGIQFPAIDAPDGDE